MTNAMNHFGYTIRNCGRTRVLLHHGGQRQHLEPDAVIGSYNLNTDDAAEALIKLEYVALQVVATVGSRRRNFDFDLVADEFGFRLIFSPEVAFEFHLTDPNPYKIILPGGVTLTA